MNILISHMWLSFHEQLLTTDNLAKRSIFISSLCSLCGVGLEAAAHIFLYYPFVLDLWVSERSRLATSTWPSSIANLWRDWRLSSIPQSEVNHWDCVVKTIFWVVWHERNQRVFKAKSSSIIELGGQISSLVNLWQAHLPIFKCHKLSYGVAIGHFRLAFALL